MAFKHLSSEERYYIEIEPRNKTSQKKIAEKLNRSQSSISREVRRNKGHHIGIGKHIVWRGKTSGKK